MSEAQQPQGPIENIPAATITADQLFKQNHALGTMVQQLQGQLNYVQGLLDNNVKKQPAPAYPTTDMPEAPKVPDQPLVALRRPDAEGVFEPDIDPTLNVIQPPVPGRLRIMIGIPMLAVSYEFFESFLRFWTELCVKRDPRYEISYIFAYRKPVHMAEEWLVKQAQANKCTHILLMDDDIYDVTKADLDKLIDADKDFISGVMHASKFPHAQCTFRRYDTSKKVIDMPADTSMYRLYEIPALCPECSHPQTHWDVKFCPACGKKIDITVQPVDLVPFPFTLIRLSVFDKVKTPWFHCTNGYPTDSWFCDRLLEAGIQPYAHMTVRLNHAGITDATKPHFMQMGMLRAQQMKAIVHLTPQQMDIHQNLLVSKMKEVEDSIKPRPPFVSKKGLVANSLDGKELTLVTAQYK